MLCLVLSAGETEIMFIWVNLEKGCPQGCVKVVRSTAGRTNSMWGGQSRCLQDE